MKHIRYFKREMAKRRGRIVSVRENHEDQQCISRTMKNYVYLVTRVDALPSEAPDPEISVIKNIDTRFQKEFFYFRVKGVVFMRRKRFIYRVEYIHSLTVKMITKTHVLSESDTAARN